MRLNSQPNHPRSRTGRAPRRLRGARAPALLCLALAWPGAAPALAPDQVYAKVSASVGLVVGLDDTANLVSQGSAVVVGDNRMVTNRHVLAPASRARVQVGGAFWDAEIRCDAGTRDLCLLEVAGLSASPVEFARIEDIKVGQAAYAIGAPNEIINALAVSLATGQKPQFELTMSNGIVSALRDTGEGKLIQTSAAISPGSSGGGLFNDQGRLIGITTFKIIGGENVNMALPVNWVSDLGVTGSALAAAGAALTSGAGAPPGPRGPPQAAKATVAKDSVFGWTGVIFGIVVILLLAFGKRIARWLADHMGPDR